MNIHPVFSEHATVGIVDSSRVQLGFVVAAGDQTFQSDIKALQTHAADLSFSRLKRFPRNVDSTKTDGDTLLAEIHRATTELLSDRELDVVCFASDSLGAHLANDRILNALRVAAPDALISSIETATKRAMRVIKARNVCIATSHNKRGNQQIAESFARFDVEVSSIHSMRDEAGFDFRSKSPKAIKEFTLSLDRADIDAIVICSTTLRAMETIEDIEQLAGKPVICSNQIAIWDSLRSAGITDKISGYGSLLYKH